MVAWQRREVISVPIEEAISRYCAVAPQSTLVKTARGLGIYLGDRVEHPARLMIAI